LESYFTFFLQQRQDTASTFMANQVADDFRWSFLIMLAGFRNIRLNLHTCCREGRGKLRYSLCTSLTGTSEYRSFKFSLSNGLTVLGTFTLLLLRTPANRAETHSPNVSKDSIETLDSPLILAHLSQEQCTSLRRHYNAPTRQHQPQNTQLRHLMKLDQSRPHVNSISHWLVFQGLRVPSCKFVKWVIWVASRFLKLIESECVCLQVLFVLCQEV
jgi:hypothetical protein